MSTMQRVRGACLKWAQASPGLILALALCLGATRKAEASSTDTIVLLVTPVVSLSVQISSPTAGIGYDFSSVDLGATSQAGTPATVTNNGNISAQWFLRSAPLDNWTPATSLGTDQAVLQALFGQPGGEYPTQTMFDSVDSTMTTTNRSSQNDALFSTGAVMGANIPASGADTRLLWFRIKMPPQSNYATQQRFRMYVVAGNP